MTVQDWKIYGKLRAMDKEKAKQYKAICKQQCKLVKRVNNPYDINQTSNWHIVKDNGIDGYIEKMFYPRCLDVTEQNEIINALTIKINYYFDCTGKPFTHWVDCFNVAGGCWIYHSIGFDC